MRLAAVLAAAFAGLLPAIAAAQPSLTPPQPPPPPVTPATIDFTRPKPEEYKDPSTAMVLSFGASAVGAGVVALGWWMRDGGDKPIMAIGGIVAVVGPSAGAWWAEGRASFTLGFGMRLGGAAIAAMTYAQAKVDPLTGEARPSDPLLGLGAAIVAAGMIYDIATAGRIAERHNARFRLAPTANGLAIAGSF